MAAKTAEVLSRGDQVRLSTNEVIPSRYRGTIAEVNTVLQTGRVGLYVKRRQESLYVDIEEVTKVPFDGNQDFPTR